MRFVMRSLVVLTFPILVFGWLSSAQLLPESPDAVSATETFVIGGLILVVAGSLWLTLADLGRAWGTPSIVPVRPIATPLVVVAGYVGAGMVGMSGLYLELAEKLVVWLGVALTIAGGFVALLAVTVMVRALAGLWSRPDLAMWPGRRAVIVLLLLTALAATPVHASRVPVNTFSGQYQSAIPLVERAWMDLSGDRAFWRYAEGDVNGLL